MDEEEVKMVAEKELKGNRQKGKALPLTLTLRLCKKWGKKGLPWEMSLLSLIASMSV